MKAVNSPVLYCANCELVYFEEDACTECGGGLTKIGTLSFDDDYRHRVAYDNI